MKVDVKLFAVARQLAKCESLPVELTDGATVADLRQELVRQCHALTDVIDHVAIAVDTEYAPEQMPIPPGAEVACIPPVSGG